MHCLKRKWQVVLSNDLLLLLLRQVGLLLLLLLVLLTFDYCLFFLLLFLLLLLSNERLRMYASVRASLPQRYPPVPPSSLPSCCPRKWIEKEINDDDYFKL